MNDNVVYKDVKVYYKNGRSKYFSEFTKEFLIMGLDLTSITGIKPMNFLERIIFKGKIKNLISRII